MDNELNRHQKTIQQVNKTIRNLKKISSLQKSLLSPNILGAKFHIITDKVRDIFGLDHCQIWVIKPGDCDEVGCQACPEKTESEGCCLHLISDSPESAPSPGRIPLESDNLLAKLAAGREEKIVVNYIPPSKEGIRQRFQQHEGLVFFAGYRLVSSTGEPIGVLAAFSRRVIAAQETILLEGVANTTSQVVQSERIEISLRDSEEKYRTLVNNINVGIYRNTGGEQGRFLEANPAIAGMFGYRSAEEFMKSPVSSFYQKPDERKLFIREMLEKGYVRNKELALRKKDGTPFWASCSAQVTFDENGEIKWIDGVIENITQRKEAEEKLRYEADHDSLTHLFNRRYFMEELSSAIDSAKRYDFPLSVCICDLDYFKRVNDNYGHKAGDQVLSSFARTMMKELRKVDIAGRYGGDEFCILFPHIKVSEAAVSAERIRKEFQATPFGQEENTAFTATATFGVADLTAENDTCKEMLKSADLALYKAKELGRNCVVTNHGDKNFPLDPKSENHFGRPE